jgi:hypothetical protein
MSGITLPTEMETYVFQTDAEETIRLETGPGKGLIRLYDEDGFLIGEDADDATAVIPKSLRKGRYTVLVAFYRNLYTTGAYTLRLKKP